MNMILRFSLGRYIGIVSIVLSFCLVGCNAWMSDSSPSIQIPPANDVPPSQVYEYKHEVRKGKVGSALMNGEKYIVALARVADTSLVDSPFGEQIALKETGNSAISQVNIQVNGEASTPASEPLKLKREANAWIDASSRALLIDALLETGVFDVLERDNINDIARELEFSTSSYVNEEETAKKGELKGARYIIKANFDINSKAFTASNPDPNTWQNDVKELPLILMLRMYDVETGRIIASGKGFGATREETIVEAVDDLIAEL